MAHFIPSAVMFHTVGGIISYRGIACSYCTRDWIILSAGLVHTDKQDGFILTRVIIDTSLLYATTLSPLMQPSSYSLYSAPMARDIFCTPSPSPGDARVMFAHTHHQRSCTPSTPPIFLLGRWKKNPLEHTPSPRCTYLSLSDLDRRWARTIRVTACQMARGTP